MAEAEHDEAQARLDAVAYEIEKSTLLAPISGLIVKKHVVTLGNEALQDGAKVQLGNGTRPGGRHGGNPEENPEEDREQGPARLDLVTRNIYFAVALAVLVLLLFLRSVASIIVAAVAIPVSIVTTFVVLNIVGSSLNVIMLAGLAFATGMVVDNAVVVLENVFRHRDLGKGRVRAALDGAREVGGAILASTLTTVAVFVPVLFIRQAALFRQRGAFFGGNNVALDVKHGHFTLRFQPQVGRIS